MSTELNSVLIVPGSTMNIFCKDGLSALDVYNIEHVYHFGGNMVFKDCGAPNEWVALNQSTEDMYHMWQGAHD